MTTTRPNFAWSSSTVISIGHSSLDSLKADLERVAFADIVAGGDDDHSIRTCRFLCSKPHFRPGTRRNPRCKPQYHGSDPESLKVKAG